jgi:hypothetical protein
VLADLSAGQVRTVLAGLARAHIVEAADAPFQPATARTPAGNLVVASHPRRLRSPGDADQVALGDR